MGQAQQRWDIFCQVVDNFGDIGISWRLARQLSDEYGLLVRLWVDDMQAASAIIPGLRARLKPAVAKAINGKRVEHPLREPIVVSGVMVCAWPQSGDHLPAQELADVVIESLGCELPAQYVAAMLLRQAISRQPVWINLEYLSAEAWVDDFHAKSSLQTFYQMPGNQASHRTPGHQTPGHSTPGTPAVTLEKHFFFPGFTPSTGGLLREQQLFTVRNKFQGSASTQQAFWTSLGVDISQLGGDTTHPATTQAARHPRIISLFCYAHARLPLLLDSLANAAKPSICIVPGDSLLPALYAWLDATGPHAPGSDSAITTATGSTTELPILRKGNVSVQVIPFLSQVQYDRLLWACDLNFVRGEDSWVRAIWSGKPFVWQPYQQEDDAHLAKLQAFLDLYCQGLAPQLAAALRQAHMAWCDSRADAGASTAGLKTGSADFEHLLASLPAWTAHSRRMSQRQAKQADLAAKLVIFCLNQV